MLKDHNEDLRLRESLMEQSDIAHQQEIQKREKEREFFIQDNKQLSEELK